MRTKFFMLCSFMMLFFTLSSFKTEMPLNEVELIIQDSMEADAVYNGLEEMGYSFTAEINGEAHTLLFQRIDDTVLSEFNLKDQDLVGSSFKVTYTTGTEVVKDSEGNDQEVQVNTITKLEKL